MYYYYHFINNLIFFTSSPQEEELVSSGYWSSPHPQLAHLPQLPHPLAHPKVQVMPAHPTSPSLPPSSPPTPPEGDDRDKFKCLYLLVETAVAVRQREKEQNNSDVTV